MKQTQIFLAVASLLSCTALNSAMTSITSVDHFNQLIGQGKVVVIDFFAVWCGPCKDMAPLMDKLSEEYSDVHFVKIDADNQALRPIAQEYQVSSLPTFVVLDGQGAVIDKFTGFSEFNVTRTKDAIRKGQQKMGGKMPEKMRPTAEQQHPKKMSQSPTPHKAKKASKTTGIAIIETPGQFAKHVIEHEGPVVIHFRKDNCTICDNIEAALAKLQPEFTDIKFVSIDAQNPKLQTIIKEEGILLLPSYEFKGMGDFKRAKDEAQLETEIKKMLKKK